MIRMSYSEDITKIKQPFPPNTMLYREDNPTQGYFPPQVLIHSLEKNLGSRWSYEILKCDIQPSHVYTQVKITIDSFSRDGYGFISYSSSKDIENVVDRSFSAALRSALNTWEVGWSELSTQKKWGNIPFIKDDLKVPSSSQLTKEQCSLCKGYLNEDDINYLKRIPGLKIHYCQKHVPDHWARKITE